MGVVGGDCDPRLLIAIARLGPGDNGHFDTRNSTGRLRIGARRRRLRGRGADEQNDRCDGQQS